ncbi:hypothetical protein KCP73_15745 [Salmonella enterica subsp. enterica]|nr:hypothetical protein KCP73_15745 [Salmonella enterica subsp. enterica]
MLRAVVRSRGIGICRGINAAAARRVLRWQKRNIYRMPAAARCVSVAADRGLQSAGNIVSGRDA